MDGVFVLNRGNPTPGIERAAVMHHRIFAVTILILFTGASEAPCSPADFMFPADPSGVTVIDRDCIREYANGEDVILYALLYSRDDLESMDILSGVIGPDGIVWEPVHTWDVLLEGEPLDILPNSVISIDSYDGRIMFSFTEDFMCYEGRVFIFLNYYTETGDFEEGWID